PGASADSYLVGEGAGIRTLNLGPSHHSRDKPVAFDTASSTSARAAVGAEAPGIASIAFGQPAPSRTKPGKPRTRPGYWRRPARCRPRRGRIGSRRGRPGRCRTPKRSDGGMRLAPARTGSAWPVWEAPESTRREPDARLPA